MMAAGQELSWLGIDVNPIFKANTNAIANANAKKEIEDSHAIGGSYSSSQLKEMREEIELANIEQVFIELARIDTERDLREIEAQRETEAANFSKRMEIVRKKIKDLNKEIDSTKELKVMLEMTNSDVNALRNEMHFIRGSERSFKSNHSVKDSNSKVEEKSVEAKLKAANKELQCITDEGYCVMSELDLVRREIVLVAKEKEGLKNFEPEATDSSVWYLSSKLLKLKPKLESSSMAEERANSIVSNLSAALQHLQVDIHAATREKEIIGKEIEAIQIEIQKSNSNTELNEDKLRETMLELEAAKIWEANAMHDLKRITEKTMTTRALLTQCDSSTITILRFEYEYLLKGATTAKEVADMKVAAAKAWMEALEVGEEELLMRSKIIEMETRELKVEEEEEEEISKLEKVVVAVENKRRSSVSISSMPRGGRRGQVRKPSISPRRRSSNTFSPPFIVKRKRKVVHKLAKLLRGRRSIGEKK